MLTIGKDGGIIQTEVRKENPGEIPLVPGEISHPLMRSIVVVNSNWAIVPL